jgi:hypothetical protein
MVFFYKEAKGRRKLKKITFIQLNLKINVHETIGSYKKNDMRLSRRIIVFVIIMRCAIYHNIYYIWIEKLY